MAHWNNTRVFEILTIVSGEADTIFHASRYWTKRQRHLAAKTFALIYFDMLQDIESRGCPRGDYEATYQGCYIKAYGWRVRDQVSLFVIETTFDGCPDPDDGGSRVDLANGAVSISSEALLTRMGRGSTYHQTRGTPIQHPPTRWRRSGVSVGQPTSNAMLFGALARAQKARRVPQIVTLEGISSEKAGGSGEINCRSFACPIEDSVIISGHILCSADISVGLPDIRVQVEFDPAALALHAGVFHIAPEPCTTGKWKTKSFWSLAGFDATVSMALSSVPLKFTSLEFNQCGAWNENLANS